MLMGRKSQVPVQGPGRSQEAPPQPGDLSPPLRTSTSSTPADQPPCLPRSLQPLWPFLPLAGGPSACPIDEESRTRWGEQRGQVRGAESWGTVTGLGRGRCEGSRRGGEGADHPWLRLWVSGSLVWAVSTTRPMLARRQLDFRIWNLMGGEYKWCHQLDGGD